MGFVTTGATVYAHYECEYCGAEGDVSQEGDEFVGGTYGLLDVQCENCGADLEEDNDY